MKKYFQKWDKREYCAKKGYRQYVKLVWTYAECQTCACFVSLKPVLFGIMAGTDRRRRLCIELRRGRDDVTVIWTHWAKKGARQMKIRVMSTRVFALTRYWRKFCLCISLCKVPANKLCGRACWRWTRGNACRCEILPSWDRQLQLVLNKRDHLSVSINSVVKNCSAETWTN